MDASSEDRPRVSHTNPPCLSVGSAPSSSPSILGIIRVWLLLEQPWDAGAPHTHPEHRSSTKPSVPNTHRNLDPVPLPPPAGKTPRCSCRDGILLRHPPGAGGSSGSPRELLIPRIPVYSGKFCLQSCSSAADFARMSAPGLRGIDDFLAEGADRGRLSPPRLSSRAWSLATFPKDLWDSTFPRRGFVPCWDKSGISCRTGSEGRVCYGGQTKSLSLHGL